MKKVLLVLLTVCILCACSPVKDTVNNQDSEVVKNEVVTLFDYNEGRGVEFEGYYDLNCDGKDDKIRVYRTHEYDKTYDFDVPKSKIEVNDSEYSYMGDIGAYDIIWIGVCDIDPADGVKDIAFIDEGDAGNRKLCILNYSKTGELVTYQFKQDPVWRNGSTEECLHAGFANFDKIEIDEDGLLLAKNCTLNATGGVMLTVDVEFKYKGDMLLDEVIPNDYPVDMSFMDNDLYKETLSGEELSMCEKGYIRSECDFSNNGITLNEGDYFKVVLWRTNGFVFVEKEDGAKGWMDGNSQTWFDINPRCFMY